MLDFKIYIIVLCVVLPIVFVALLITIPRYTSRLLTEKSDKPHKASKQNKFSDDENL